VLEVMPVSERDLRPDCPADVIERREFLRNLLLGLAGLPTMAAVEGGAQGPECARGGALPRLVGGSELRSVHLLRRSCRNIVTFVCLSPIT